MSAAAIVLAILGGAIVGGVVAVYVVLGAIRQSIGRGLGW